MWIPKVDPDCRPTWTPEVERAASGSTKVDKAQALAGPPIHMNVTDRLQPIPRGSGRIASFLMTSLRGGTIGAYAKALDAFKAEVIESRGFDWNLLNETARDATVAQYCLECLEAGVPSCCLIALVGALAKICPRQRYRSATVAVLAWAFAVPREFCGAIAVVMLLLNRPVDGDAATPLPGGHADKPTS